MHVHGVVVLVWLAGCGRVAFDVRSDVRSDVSSLDAAPPTGPFGAAVAISSLSSPSQDDDVSLTGDMLEVYFMSMRDGADRIYFATRASVDDDWSVPAVRADLSTGDINNPRISADGLSLVFASGRPPNAGMYDLWLATRVDRTSPWSVQRLDSLATAESELEPWLVDSQLSIYFSGRLPNGRTHLYVAERAAKSDPFGAPRDISDTVVNSNYEGGVWVDPAERTMLFHRSAQPSQDIYIATRTSRAVPFDSATRLDGVDINTPGVEQDPWLSPDGHTLVFVSNRAGNADFYIATR